MLDVGRWLDTLFMLLPYAIRLVQCVRRHVDAAAKNGGKGFFHAPTQLYNACKYASCMLVTIMSWMDHMWVSDRVERHVVPTGYPSWSEVCASFDLASSCTALETEALVSSVCPHLVQHDQLMKHPLPNRCALLPINHNQVPLTEVTLRPYRAAWLCAVLFATVFKLYWDVVHDFGFTLKFWELRPKKLYPDPVYYFVLVANLLLRVSWITTISPGFFGIDHLGKQSGLWLSTFTAIGEVIRRFLWTLVRVESEHVSSCCRITPAASDNEATILPVHLSLNFQLTSSLSTWQCCSG